MVGDGVLHHAKQLLRGVGRLDAQLEEQLRHEKGEAAKGSREARLRIHLNQHVLLRVNVHLEEAGSVQRAVKEHQQALVENVRPAGGGVLAVLPNEVPMVVGVQQLKGRLHLHHLEVGALEDDDQPLRLVGDVLEALRIEQSVGAGLLLEGAIGVGNFVVLRWQLDDSHLLICRVIAADLVVAGKLL